VAGHLSRRGVTAFLVGAALGATTMGTVDRLRQQPTASPSPPSLPAPAPAPEPPPPEPMPPAESEPPATTAAPNLAARRTISQPQAEPRDKRLEAERKLIEMARTSLARGQSEGALGVLRRHLRLYPKGELAEERDSLWVSVLVARGEPAQARDHALRFHRRYPHSLFGPMVDQAVKSIP
jgi:hypothetical protein